MDLEYVCARACVCEKKKLNPYYIQMKTTFAFIFYYSVIFWLIH